MARRARRLLVRRRFRRDRRLDARRSRDGRDDRGRDARRAVRGRADPGRGLDRARRDRRLRRVLGRGPAAIFGDVPARARRRRARARLDARGNRHDRRQLLRLRDRRAAPRRSEAVRSGHRRGPILPRDGQPRLAELRGDRAVARVLPFRARPTTRRRSARSSRSTSSTRTSRTRRGSPRRALRPTGSAPRSRRARRSGTSS